VLEATAPDALDRWLKRNGYPSSPALLEWYRPYVEGRWIVTAFKIARQGVEMISPAAVRMSFQTERPFFPYSEPKGEVGKERLLRVSILAEARYGASDGWAGKTVFAGRLDGNERDRLLARLRLANAGQGTLWVTEFEDRSDSRAGAPDVHFMRAGDQSTLLRTGTATSGATFLVWLIGAVAVFAIIAVLLLRTLRKKARG